MMMRVWRITHRDYKKTAFTGEGAELYGGRFNSEGIPLVYSSGNLSLAMLELIVQSNGRDYFKSCVFFHADIPGELIYKPDLKKMPKEWNSVPYRKASQKFGDHWVASGNNPVMRIPSVVVPGEYNYVMNPLHPDFGQIEYSETESVKYDERLSA